MNSNRFSFSRFNSLTTSLLAVLTVAVTTIPLFIIGRNTLGEAVIALLYLVPVAWSANRWGQLPGISAALTAALAFDFLFIPPFFTFAVERLEGWLVLVIFLGVAIWVVERIQTSLTQAREAVFMYEMSAALCGQRTPEAVAYTVAKQIQQLYQAMRVNVIFNPEKQVPAIVASEPKGGMTKSRPDRDLPIVNSWGLVGEIQIWRGLYSELPPEDGRLLQNFALQTARAFERTSQFEAENRLKGMPASSPVSK
jgi:two-component system sensor histidine kinase KdpD